jgi:hypothetical protein
VEAEPNNEVYRRIIEAVSRDAPDALDDLMSPDIVDHNPAPDSRRRGTGSRGGWHRGEFAGIPPTGKPVAFAAFHIVRFSEERAVEWWGTADLLGALRQLGATVAPPTA